MSGTTPIMKLALLSSLLLVALAGCNTAPPPPRTEAEAIDELAKQVSDMIEADTHEQAGYTDIYLEYLETLHNKCSEPFTTTIKSTVDRTRDMGHLGEQFAWLNTLAETDAHLEGVQGPVACEPIIAEVSF
jgi:hypothetical protein